MWACLKVSHLCRLHQGAFTPPLAVTDALIITPQLCALYARNTGTVSRCRELYCCHRQGYPIRTGCFGAKVPVGSCGTEALKATPAHI